MGGTSIYCGKPHPPIYDLARTRLTALTGFPPVEPLCLGDGIETDVQGGLGESHDTLFITGGLAAGAFGEDPANPDAALLDDWISARGLSPTFAIGALR